MTVQNYIRTNPVGVVRFLNSKKIGARSLTDCHFDFIGASSALSLNTFLLTAILMRQPVIFQSLGE